MPGNCCSKINPLFGTLELLVYFFTNTAYVPDNSNSMPSAPGEPLDLEVIKNKCL